MMVDRYDTLDLRSGREFERLATGLLPQLVRPNDVVIDVGANIGYYTLLCARLVGPHGRVHAFEPEPRNFALLEQNISLNNYRNVVAARSALGARSEVGRLWINLGSNQGDHRIYDPMESNRQTTAIDVVALDDVLPLGARVGLVKMDIQGGEPFALAGMRAVLSRSPDAKLLTEFWPFGMRRAGVASGDYLDQLAALGFVAWFDVDETSGRVVAVDRARLLQHYPVAEDRFTNLLCLREAHGWDAAMDVRP